MLTCFLLLSWRYASRNTQIASNNSLVMQQQNGRCQGAGHVDPRQQATTTAQHKNLLVAQGETAVAGCMSPTLLLSLLTMCSGHLTQHLVNRPPVARSPVARSFRWLRFRDNLSGSPSPTAMSRFSATPSNSPSAAPCGTTAEHDSPLPLSARAHTTHDRGAPLQLRQRGEGAPR